MRRRTTGMLLLVIVWNQQLFAQPEEFEGAVATEKPIVLHRLQRPRPQPIPLPKDSPLLSLDELQFTGPNPAHPFVLGNFASEGTWGLVQGCVQVVQGKDAALQLAWADQFEMEGEIEHAGMGGWFFLVGWDQGRGYAISNVLMKQSGSPWFISELRGAKAIDGKTQEYDYFDWKGSKTFRMVVEDQKLTLKVGRFVVFNREPLENYAAGRIILGVYDTRYGPKPLRIKSLVIRALPKKEKKAEEQVADMAE